LDHNIELNFYRKNLEKLHPNLGTHDSPLQALNRPCDAHPAVTRSLGKKIAFWLAQFLLFVVGVGSASLLARPIIFLQPNSNFHGANMKLVNLDSADVENSDFTDTILEEAYVANAQFKGIKIAGSDCESNPRCFACLACCLRNLVFFAV